MAENDSRLIAIWHQTTVPVVFKREKAPLLVRLPYAKNNYDWLRDGNRSKPAWSDQYKAWEAPAAWFENVAKRLVGRFNKAYVIQLHRSHQVCARACWDANGLHCECSCMGANHGSGQPAGKWYEVSDTFAANWGPKEYACRLLVSSTSLYGP